MNKQWVSQLPIHNINNMKTVSGGDVNDAYEIETDDQKYFLLVQPNATKEFFQTEAAGLKDLKNAGIVVPEVYNYGEIDSDTYLLISFLEEGSTRNYKALAKMIVKMHQTNSNNELFGYQYPHQGSDITFDNE